jgi:hypothetical protein
MNITLDRLDRFFRTRFKKYVHNCQYGYYKSKYAKHFNHILHPTVDSMTFLHNT